MSTQEIWMLHISILWFVSSMSNTFIVTQTQFLLLSFDLFRLCLHIIGLPCSLQSAFHHLSCALLMISTPFLCWDLSLTWLTSSPKQLICLVPLLQSYNVLLEKPFGQLTVATNLWLFKFPRLLFSLLQFSSQGSCFSPLGQLSSNCDFTITKSVPGSNPSPKAPQFFLIYTSRTYPLWFAWETSPKSSCIWTFGTG